ncbi:MAG: hypothetical protein HY314_12520 [Acidobacteria bacterium]|nr:hypothetical protein [Acidobacteriota bacterium]
MIWSKAYVMERERFDGADIIHLIRACGERLDWSRLLRRFGPHRRVLLSYLVLFGFVYPGEHSKIPGWVMKDLLRRMQNEMNDVPTTDRLCQGTLLSREQYLVDIVCWGYEDARLRPWGTLTPDQTAQLTAEIEER